MKGPRRGPGSDARAMAPKTVTSAETPKRPVLVCYGMAEIAELVDYPRTNTVRLRKQLPPPDITLKMGPVWFGGTVQRWLKDYNARRSA